MLDKSSEMGGLWLKESAAGKKYMSGKLTLNGSAVEVVVFKNEHKQQGERTPDYRVYVSRPRDGAPQPRDDGQRQRDTATRAQRPVDDSELDDSIPF